MLLPERSPTAKIYMRSKSPTPLHISLKASSRPHQLLRREAGPARNSSNLMPARESPGRSLSLAGVPHQGSLMDQNFMTVDKGNTKARNKDGLHLSWKQDRSQIGRMVSHAQVSIQLYYRVAGQLPQAPMALHQFWDSWACLAIGRGSADRGPSCAGFAGWLPH